MLFENSKALSFRKATSKELKFQKRRMALGEKVSTAYEPSLQKRNIQRSLSWGEKISVQDMMQSVDNLKCIGTRL